MVITSILFWKFWFFFGMNSEADLLEPIGCHVTPLKSIKISIFSKNHWKIPSFFEKGPLMTPLNPSSIPTSDTIDYFWHLSATGWINLVYRFLHIEMPLFYCLGGFCSFGCYGVLDNLFKSITFTLILHCKWLFAF